MSLLYLAITNAHNVLLPWAYEDVQRETEEESEVALGEGILT